MAYAVASSGPRDRCQTVAAVAAVRNAADSVVIGLLLLVAVVAVADP